MKKTFITLMLGLCLLTGCEKEAIGVKLPMQSPKLVVTSFISPQDTITLVSVSNTRPIYGKQNSSNNLVLGATVTLSDGNQEVQLLFQSKQRAYGIDSKTFPIKPGTTYYLQVQAPDGRQAKAACTVPKDTVSVTISHVGIDPAAVEDRHSRSMQYELSFQWTDIAGVANYYRIKAETVNYQEEFKGEVVTALHPSTDEEEEFITDKNADGAVVDTRKTFYGKKITKPFNLFVYVVNADVHYYRYHYGLTTNDYAGDNPFAEPTLLYTNIEGGVGVFAAYTRSEALLEVE